MAKETFYFSHDYNSRSDKNLVKVRMRMGMAGVGLYWCIVEMLYEEGGYLNRSEYERISFELQSNYDDVTMLIEQFELFKFDAEKFWSNSALERLKIRQNKSDKARESINYRWNNTNVKRSNDKRNTIKERKGKENKVKEIKNNKEQQAKPVGFVTGNKIVSSKKNSMSTTKDTESIPLPFNSPEFASIWAEWLQNRKEARIKNYTPTGLKRLFNWLVRESRGDESIAIQIIDQSLTKGWQGLFELKNTYKNGTHQQQPASIGKTIEFD